VNSIKESQQLLKAPTNPGIDGVIVGVGVGVGVGSEHILLTQKLIDSQ
jgi:hypothetical protein